MIYPPLIAKLLKSLPGSKRSKSVHFYFVSLSFPVTARERVGLLGVKECRMKASLVPLVLFAVIAVCLAEQPSPNETASGVAEGRLRPYSSAIRRPTQIKQTPIRCT